MNLQPGTILKGSYRIVRFIASGGFGCTYEAEHIELRARVAVKEFFVKDFCNRDEHSGCISVGITSRAGLVDKLRNKFKDEARAIWGLRHRGIVRVTDVFDENGTSYYVMDYIEGTPLDKMLAKNSPMAESEAIGYIARVCDALTYVHSNNRLHLDIKPANIMIDREGNAVLIDFGASKQYDEVDGHNTSTVSGLTPGFAPIEQMDNDVTVFTPATDVYSLGATLYNLLTGKVPPSASALASMRLPELPDHISPATRHAVISALRLNKFDRPQSAEEFKQMLEDAAPAPQPAPIPTQPLPRSGKHHPQHASGGKTKTLSEVKREKKRSNKALIFGLLIGLVVVAVAIAVWPSKQSESVESEAIAGPTILEGEIVEAAEVLSPLTGEKFTYSGKMVNGLPNGEGKGVYADGVYEGNYADGLRSGQGVYTTKPEKNGTYERFEGTFADDHYDNGKLEYVGSDMVFEGKFSSDNNPAEGRLVLDEKGAYFYGTFKDGECYNGNCYKADGSFDFGYTKGTQVNYQVKVGGQ